MFHKRRIKTTIVTITDLFNHKSVQWRNRLYDVTAEALYLSPNFALYFKAVPSRGF
jgi:hypothetical protein